MKKIHTIEHLLGEKNERGDIVVSVEIFLDKTVSIGLRNSSNQKKIILGKNLKEAMMQSKLKFDYRGDL